MAETSCLPPGTSSRFSRGQDSLLNELEHYPMLGIKVLNGTVLFGRELATTMVAALAPTKPVGQTSGQAGPQELLVLGQGL